MKDIIKKCPKCKQEAIEYIEIWENSLEFSIENGKIEEEGILRPGTPKKIIGVCACNHRWRIRKVNQIINLKGEYK